MGFCLNLLRDWVNRDIELVTQLHGALVSSLKWHNYSLCPTELFWGLNEHVCRTVSVQFIVHLLSHVRLFAIPWTAARQASLSFIISQNLLKLVSIESVMPSHPHLIPFSFFSVFPSIRVFSSELALHFRWPGYWIFSFRISPSSEYSVYIPFRIDWFNLLAVQGTPKSLLQHHSLRASILYHSAFFMVQLSHLYMTTGKSIALTIQTFVTKWYLFFNMGSRFVITFLLKSKFMAIVTTVILEPPPPPQIKSVIVSIFSIMCCLLFPWELRVEYWIWLHGSH